ncbi:hypothetical protein SFRURICE_011866 [Spodoptera frugiperda]|nr:hypothetical protein SFRURICE_011866 [Spodoptera frugiperda]
MALFLTPPRVPRTRAHLKQELTANEEDNKIEVRSDVQCAKKRAVKEIGQVKSDICLPRANSSFQQDGGARALTSSHSHASSSAARRLRLEYETAKAQIEIQEVREKSRIEKELLKKKMAIEVAELQSQSRCSEKQSCSSSYKSKVENWLEKFVVEPGKSHDCYNKAMVGDGEQHRHVGGNDSDKPPTDAAGNYVTAVTTMKQSDYLRSPQLTSIVVSKLPSNLLSKWIDYLNERSQEDTPKLQLLSQFLYVEAEKVAASGVSFIHSQAEHQRYRADNKTDKKHPHSVLTAVAVNDPDVKCKFCRRNEHSLPECGKFKRALRKDRWRFVRGNQLCYKCLCARHPDPAACTAGSCDVEACGGPHHRLLHWTKPEAARQEPPAPPGDASKPESELVAHANVTRAAECSEVSVLNVPNATQTLSATKVVLKIVPVTVHGPKTSVNTHALLDDGATVTLISADLADKVGLHGKTVTMRASGAWDSELVCQTELIKCAISNSNGDKYELRARKLKELNLPVQFVSSVECSEHVPNINYSLYSNIKVKPKLLIGQDNYDLIAPLVCKKYKTSGPFITQTLLGWCVHGALRQTDFTDKRAEHANSASSVSGRGAAPPERPLALTQLGESLQQPNLISNVDIDLHDLIRRSFALDSIGISNTPRRNIDEVRAVRILDESAELINGQWTVKLPWKHDVFELPDSYSMALKRLKSVERKMLHSSEYQNRYSDRLRQSAQYDNV